MGTKQNIRADGAFQHLSVQVFRNGGQGHETQGPLDKGLPGSNVSRTAEYSSTQIENGISSFSNDGFRLVRNVKLFHHFGNDKGKKGNVISCSAGLEGTLVCAIGELRQQLVMLRSGNCSRASEVVLGTKQRGQVRLQWRNGWPALVGEALDLGNGRIRGNWHFDLSRFGECGGPEAHGSGEARPDGVWTARLCCPENSRQIICFRRSRFWHG
nr:uncharacterized protein LOC129160743 [Nothobranchius furzeri]